MSQGAPPLDTPSERVAEVVAPEAPSAAAARRRFSTLTACAWAGPIYMVGLIFAFAVVAGFVPPPREHWSAEQLTAFYRDNDTRIKLGMEGMILFACLYYFWSLAVARVMERTEGHDSLLTRIQVFGGLSTAWITAGTGIAFLITAFRAGERNPEDLRLFNDTAFLVFNMTAMFTYFQLIAVAIAWLKPDRDHAVVPRWVGYMSLWVCATFLVVFLIPFVQHGPFTWHGLITFYTTLSLFFLWMTVVSWHVLRAIRRDPQIRG